jgi:succinyl-CoA synthetase alpha subunit
MSILVNSNTKVITQGMTGETGTFHTQQALAYGTKMVGGVTPGKGGQTHIGLPVFDTVAEAVEATGADASVVYVPPPFAADSILEAIDAEVPLIVCITEGIPVLDMVKVKRRAFRLEVAPHRAELPGRADSERVQDRNHAGQHLQEGLGRRRQPLGHAHLRGGVPDLERGLGQTTAVGIGGDPVNGTNFIDVLELFLADDETKSIIMIGEIGGSAEEDAGPVPRRRGEARPSKPTSASSPAAPRLRAAAWAMPARSSRAARAAPTTRSRRWSGLEFACPQAHLSLEPPFRSF